MKKFMIMLSCLFGMAVMATAEDKPISFDKLPLEAKNFINVTFQDVKVLYAAVDDDLIRPDYKVALENGFRIQFTNSGALEKIESTSAPIPEGIVPYQILDYVKLHYPSATCIEYEVGRKGYEVKLSNRLELKFNRKFHLVEIDD